MRAGRATDPTAARRPWHNRLRAFLGKASAIGLVIGIGLAIGLALLLPFCPPAQAASQAEGPGPLEKLRPPIKTSAPGGHLQELPPPLAVQQIQAALADRQPRVTILAPTDGTNLPNGNWTLKLLAQDWPLTDGGALGLGPHVVIQIDDQEPIRLTEHRSTPQGDSLQLTLPALTPGSHRITAYAAKPWGEAAKNSGAASQIRVDRVAANPLTVPKPGSPQLLPVSPLGVVGSEPVLLDWLLLDAPLQHLRDNDGSWRLRVSVNGESFITDQNVPIWLKGWTNGSNSLQLELLDGRGKPLNPPFNSLVSELVLKPSAPKPRWQLGRLSAEELASLVGQTPTPAPQPAPQPPPQPTSKPETETETEHKVEPQGAVEEPEPQLAEPEPTQSENAIVAPNSTEARDGESATTAPEESPGENGDQTLLEDNPPVVFQPSDPKPGPNPEAIDDNADDQPTVLVDRMEEPATEEPAAELPSTTPDALANPEDLPNLEELANRDDPAEPSASGDRDAVIPPPITNPD
uniref:hypothetical protein n=1 Tax=Cyanobium sp. TaxID=2164130 RepID=UPI004048D8AA